jgi:hypothetical protein
LNGKDKRLVEMARCVLAAALALGAGLLAQSVLLAGVLAVTSPGTLRFFDFALFLNLVPTGSVLLLVGAPFFCARRVRDWLGSIRSAVVGALLGALGASLSELYSCMNFHLRCFLDTSRDAAAGLGSILCGAACGAIVCLVYRRLMQVRHDPA